MLFGPRIKMSIWDFETNRESIDPDSYHERDESCNDPDGIALTASHCRPLKSGAQWASNDVRNVVAHIRDFLFPIPGVDDRMGGTGEVPKSRPQSKLVRASWPPSSGEGWSRPAGVGAKAPKKLDLSASEVPNVQLWLLWKLKVKVALSPLSWVMSLFWCLPLHMIQRRRTEKLFFDLIHASCMWRTH